MASKTNVTARNKTKVKVEGVCGHELTWVKREKRMLTYCYTCNDYIAKGKYNPYSVMLKALMSEK